MKDLLKKLEDPDFGDKCVMWACVFGFGFVIGLLVVENACMKGVL